MANLLFRLPRLSGFGIPPVWAALRAHLIFLSAVLTPILVLTLPALLGYAITSGAKGDMAGAVASCYAIGFILLLTAIMRNLGKEKELTPDEVAYGGWDALGNPYVTGPWLVAGVGTLAYLKGMMRKGAAVPPVALDLCAMLATRMTAGDCSGSSRS